MAHQSSLFCRKKDNTSPEFSYMSHHCDVVILLWVLTTLCLSSSLVPQMVPNTPAQPLNSDEMVVQDNVTPHNIKQLEYLEPTTFSLVASHPV